MLVLQVHAMAELMPVNANTKFNMVDCLLPNAMPFFLTVAISCICLVIHLL